MNSQYAALIAKERLKIEAFHAEIKKCEERIAVFQSMDGDDELYELLAKKVGEDVAKNQQSTEKQSLEAFPLTTPSAEESIVNVNASSLESGAFPKRTLSEKTLKMLRFATTADKSVREFFEYARANNVMQERARVRNFLNLYKTSYGLLESDRDGYFRLSDRGVAYLKSLEESPSNKEVPSSAA